MPVRIEIGGPGSRELDAARQDLMRSRMNSDYVLLSLRSGDVDAALDHLRGVLRWGLHARTNLVKARRRAMLGEQKKKQQLKKKGK